MTTIRPEHIDAGPHTADDGLFGLDSVTWSAWAHPVGQAIGGATAMRQMLYPPVMYMIGPASSFQQIPESRARRTGCRLPKRI